MHKTTTMKKAWQTTKGNITLSHYHRVHEARLWWPGVFLWAALHVSFQTPMSLHFDYLNFCHQNVTTQRAKQV